MIRKLLVIILTISVLLCGCNNTNDSNQRESMNKKDTTDADESYSGKSVIKTSDSKSKVLGIYTYRQIGRSDYKSQKIALAWIDAYSGDKSIYREFNSNDDSVTIPIEEDCISEKYGRRFLRQKFDENYDRVVASNEDSCGWIDKDGNYIDVSSKLFKDDDMYRLFRSVAFKDGFYYFICLSISKESYDKYIEIRDKTTSDMNAAKTALELLAERKLYAYRIPINKLQKEYLETVEIYEKEEIAKYALTEEGAFRQDFYIQSFGGVDKAIFYRKHMGPGNEPPIYYKDENSKCINPAVDGDWISEDKIISSTFSEIYTYSTFTKKEFQDIVLTHDYAEGNKRLYTILEDDVYGRTYYNSPILNEDKNQFVCIEIMPSYLNNCYISFFTLEGELLRCCNAYSIKSDSGIVYNLGWLLDWQGESVNKSFDDFDAREINWSSEYNDNAAINAYKEYLSGLKFLIFGNQDLRYDKKNNDTSKFSFNFTDINGDEIPELIISNGYEDNKLKQIYVFNYYHDEVVYCGNINNDIYLLDKGRGIYTINTVNGKDLDKYKEYNYKNYDELEVVTSYYVRSNKLGDWLIKVSGTNDDQLLYMADETYDFEIALKNGPKSYTGYTWDDLKKDGWDSVVKKFYDDAAERKSYDNGVG